MAICPCGSGRDFAECCGPLIAGEPAETAEALMRSRYTAFTLVDLDYIEKTCSENALDTLNRVDMEHSLPGTKWLGLQIVEATDGGAADETGTVKFSFRYQNGGRDFSQLEIASFVREGGLWKYDASEVNPKPQTVRVEHIGRNDPCPCGSGKKYKKCCGAAA